MASAGDAPLVLVTGASGFVAKYIIKQLLEEGSYRVRGTVRSLENEAKVTPIKELCPDAAHPIELVEADLLNEESWEGAVKDCSYVMHTASPFVAVQPEDPDVLLKPAKEGTLNVLKACQKARVQRVVLTSSFAAIFHVGDPYPPADKTLSEEDWSSADKGSTYERSKVLAEKAAWDFVKELPEEEKFELVVINPTYVHGPVLTSATDYASLHALKMLLDRQVPAVPKVQFQLCDVRDVAAAHVKALTLPEAAGNRHLIFSTGMTVKEMALVLSKEFKPQGYNVPTMQAPYALLWFKALFDKLIKGILPMVGKQLKLDNTRMKDVLGIQPRDMNETLIEMAYSMIEHGVVKKSKKYRGPGGVEEVKADANGAVPKEGTETEKKEEGGEEEKQEEGEEKAEKKEEGEKKEEETEAEKKEEETEAEKKKEAGETEKKEEGGEEAEKKEEEEATEQKKEGEADKKEEVGEEAEQTTEEETAETKVEEETAEKTEETGEDIEKKEEDSDNKETEKKEEEEEKKDEEKDENKLEGQKKEEEQKAA